MVTLNAMYKGRAFSPPTTLTQAVNAAATVIPVADTAVFPPAPNYATIGTDEEGEVILYSAVTAEALSGCTRGVKGGAKAWAAGDPIARNWSSADHDALIDSITALNEGKEESLTNIQAKTTPVDADTVVILDSSTDNSRKKLTWANSKAALKIYFDSLYATLSHLHTQRDINGLETAMAGKASTEALAAHAEDTNNPHSVTAEQANADPAGTAANAVSDHNASRDAHSSILADKQDKIIIAGLLKGNGTVVEQAAAGTDYVAPAALAGYLPTAQKGAAQGVATLDAESRVTATQASAALISVTASRTLSVADDNRCLVCESAQAITITIPANAAAALPVGAEIEVMQTGAGAVSFAPATGVTVHSADNALAIAAQYGVAALKQIAANVWLLCGALSA